MRLMAEGVHVVTVNDYLARRDAVWMGQMYAALGMSVGVINHRRTRTAMTRRTREVDAVRDEEGSVQSLPRIFAAVHAARGI